MAIGMKPPLKVFLAAAAIPCLGLAFYVLFDSGMIRLNYPSKEEFPVWGIDVSHHQGQIDWAAVAADKTIRFAYIKASEGGDFRDTRFAENWKRSGDVGIVRGAYHFFTFCRTGKDQAKNFLATVPVEPDTLPIAVDLEFVGNCSARPSVDGLIAELNDFLSDIRKVHPRKPVFYVTPEFYDRYMKDNLQRFPDHHLWLRNIFYEPSQKQCERWRFWQFADRDRINGITGLVDLNVFCGDRAAFSSLSGSASIE